MLIIHQGLRVSLNKPSLPIQVFIINTFSTGDYEKSTLHIQGELHPYICVVPRSCVYDSLEGVLRDYLISKNILEGLEEKNLDLLTIFSKSFGDISNYIYLNKIYPITDT